VVQLEHARVRLDLAGVDQLVDRVLGVQRIEQAAEQAGDLVLGSGARASASSCTTKRWLAVSSA
jgi:hypothetical protein